MVIPCLVHMSCKLTQQLKYLPIVWLMDGNSKEYFLKKWAQYEAGFGTPGKLQNNLLIQIS